MIYIYRREASNGARELCGALRARRHRDRMKPMAQRVRVGDVIVCWGEALPAIAGVKILNGITITNKYTDALVLREAGVPTIEAAQRRPLAPAPAAVVDPALELFNHVKESAEDFTALEFSRSMPMITGVSQLRQTLMRFDEALQRPLPAPVQIPAADWLPRTNNHVGGNDLLHPERNTPDFWVKKEGIVKEYRIHSFKGKSLRAGIKAVRDGFPSPHAWIRSHDAGWRIKYDGVSSKKKHRELAHKAVEALGLDFGAVDIAERADGSLFVLECNRAPGIESGTITVYADAITRWIRGEE